MLLRKITVGFLVALFVVLALPNFFIYGLSRTYLNSDFYRREDVTRELYNFTLDKTVDELRLKSDFFKDFFTAPELREHIANVFTEAVFSQISGDFADQIEKYKQNSVSGVSLSLRVLRDNLLTVANNMAYLLYKELPSCSDNLPQLDKFMVPQCAPSNVPYETVVKPMMDNFETTIYNKIPENLSNLEQVVPLNVLINIEKYREITFVFLVLILVLIVLMVYGKISSILGYISLSFIFSGIVGYVFGLFLIFYLGSNNIGVVDLAVHDLILRMLGFLVVESQKLSIIFLIVGGAFLIIRYVLKRTIDRKSVVSEIRDMDSNMS